MLCGICYPVPQNPRPSAVSFSGRPRAGQNSCKEQTGQCLPETLISEANKLSEALINHGPRGWPRPAKHPDSPALRRLQPAAFDHDG